jgi:hypothetical protein
MHYQLEGVYEAPQVLEGWCTIGDKADLVKLQKNARYHDR